MASTTTVTPEKARANARKILQLWRQGRQSLNRLRKLNQSDPAALKYGRKEDTFAGEAGLLGTNVDTAAKMRRVARGYTREQIKGLCDLVRKHRSRFGPSHLLILLRVKKGTRRDAMTRQAVREGWTTVRLERAAQAEKRTRREWVGRKPQVPEGRVEVLLTLDALSEKWCRWCEEADPGLPEELKGLVSRVT